METTHNHQRTGQQYWATEMRTTSGKLLIAEGRTEGESKAAMSALLNRHVHNEAAKVA